MRIGIDIGGVIIDRVKNGKYDTSFKVTDISLTPAVEGSFAAIKDATSIFQPENVYLVSVCDKDTQRKTEEWLAFTNFYEITGMLSENSYNCTERSQKTIIAKELQLTHFVDDRPDVLKHMIGTVDHLYLFCAPGNAQVGDSSNFNIARSWLEALQLIKRDIKKDGTKPS